VMVSSTNLKVVKNVANRSRIGRLVERVAYFIWKRGSCQGEKWDWYEAQNMVADHWADGLDIDMEISTGIGVFRSSSEDCYFDRVANSAIDCYKPDASVWSSRRRIH